MRHQSTVIRKDGRIELTCARCQEPFSVRAYVHRRDHTRFCSRLCWHMSLRQQPSQCLQCGQDFHVPPSKIRAGTRFCSNECRLAHCKSRHAIASRFWSKVQKADGCWIWTACLSNKGYGKFGFTHGVMPAHRVAYELTNGTIPDGLFVCHRCDNPRCVNPAHLFLGTNADNTADKTAKGRALHGETHPNAKLTLAEVRAIRSAYADGGISQLALGRAHGVSLGTVNDILRQRTWAWSGADDR